MSFIYAMADTWNAIGTTFNSILMNASNGAGGAPVGAAASRLLNLQANSISVFTVDVAGKTVINSNAVTAASLPAPPAGTGLQVSGADTVNTAALVDGYGAAPIFYGRRAAGTAAIPTGLQSGDAMVYFQALGRDSSAYAGTSGYFVFQTSEIWSPTAHGTDLVFTLTPSTTVALTTSFIMYNNGGFAVNTVNNPGAGAIYINNATFLIRTKTSFTNGAAAQVGTLTNAPAAGNPTKWIAIDDNGTTRQIPAW